MKELFNLISLAYSAAKPLFSGSTANTLGCVGRSAIVTGRAAAGVTAARSLLSDATAQQLGQSVLRAAGPKAREAAVYLAAGFVAQQFVEHVVNNYVMEGVRPVAGSIVYCKLGLLLEHSGIYVGDDSIVHLDGSGQVEAVGRKEFLGRLYGLNPALSVYVSSKGDRAIGSRAAAQRAMDAVGDVRNYNMLLDNCHCFTSGCIDGEFENSDRSWLQLKGKGEQHFGADCWRVWQGD